jgi:hypothetical protein
MRFRDEIKAAHGHDENGVCGEGGCVASCEPFRWRQFPVSRPKRLRAITPVVIPSAEHWRMQEDREYFLDGLRMAVGAAPEEV